MSGTTEETSFGIDMASLIGWRRVGVPHASLSTKAIWGSFVNNVAYRKAKRWWPYLLKRDQGQSRRSRQERMSMPFMVPEQGWLTCT